MSQSGISVDDNVVTTFNEMKMGHKHRYIIYKINDDMSSVVIEEQAGKEKTFDDFRQVCFLARLVIFLLQLVIT